MGGEGWQGRTGRIGWAKFEEGGMQYIGGLHKIGVLGTLCQQ